MKYLKLFENFTGSELEEDLKWIMVNFLDDQYRFELKQNIHDKLFVYEILGNLDFDYYDLEKDGRLDVLNDLIKDLEDGLEFYISDSEIGIGFREYIDIYKNIKKYNIKNWTINNDLTIDVNGRVFLINNGLTKLPLKFNKVTGTFDCRDNQLTTLDGSPKEVGGGFLCSYNKLKSLVGGPNIVVGDFGCDNNKLDTFEGSPKSVGNNFLCNKNYGVSLLSLDQLPKKIGGLFYCDSKISGFLPENIRGKIVVVS